MKISANQSQLLRQLNIRPLQARAALFRQSDVYADKQSVDTSTLLKPDDTPLSADIWLMLQHLDLNDWLLDPASQQCMLNHEKNLLITPDLASLQQPALKRQLWALLEQQLVDHAD